MPHRRSLGMIWRRMPQRYRMVGTKCETCGEHFFPPRSFCPECRRKSKIVEKEMSGKGKVFSFTVVQVPLDGFQDSAPYALAIVELKEGPKVLGQIADVNGDELKIGMPVEMCFRKISEDGESGIIHYGYKFIKA